MSEFFVYELPAQLIAQRPIDPPEAARLISMSASVRDLAQTTFRDLPDMLGADHMLVFNNTKVLPARLFGRLGGDGPEVEVLLTREIEPESWFAMGRPRKKLRSGGGIHFADGLIGEIVGSDHLSEVEIRFFAQHSNYSVSELLTRTGVMPIPPYIRGGRADGDDRVDYQSIFAKYPGSIAAPTASLHFSPELIERLTESGVRLEFLTLHLNVASFQPLDRVVAPGVELCSCSPAAWNQIIDFKAAGGKVIAVGTSMVRALEFLWRYSEGGNRSLGGEERDAGELDKLYEVDLFIKPGFDFGLIDGVVTNFHQPGSSHLALVEALVGRERLAQIYQLAVREEYRFLSYGDGMLLSYF